MSSSKGRVFTRAKSWKVLMEDGFAKGLGIRLDDLEKSTVKIRVQNLARAPPQAFRVVGLLAPTRVDLAKQGGAIFLPLGDAQAIVNAPWAKSTA